MKVAGGHGAMERHGGAAGCSEADAGSPGHRVVPCPGCTVPLPPGRRAGTSPVLPLAGAVAREGGVS